jgi:hypothetical protein
MKIKLKPRPDTGKIIEVEKFAWLPKVVERPGNHRYLVWLDYYTVWYEYVFDGTSGYWCEKATYTSIPKD